VDKALIAKIAGCSDGTQITLSIMSGARFYVELSKDR
jgi:hypothetical protein